MFSIFDAVLIVLLFGFIFFGLFMGLIQTFGALVGVVLGAWAAGHYFLPLAGWISGIIGFSNNTIKVIIFILLFILINQLIGFLFWVLNKIFHIIAVIPFLKTINRLAGAFLGLIEGSMVLGLILYIISKYSLGARIDNALKASKVAPKFITIARILLPLIPTTIKAVKGIL